MSASASERSGGQAPATAPDEAYGESSHRDRRQAAAPAWDESYDLSSARNSRGSIRSDGWDPGFDALQLWRWRCRRILSTHEFDTFIGLVIVANCVTIGLDQANRLEDKDMDDTTSSSSELEAAENIFLMVYVVELGMRFFGFGWWCIKDNWVKFDCLLVASSILFGWTFKLFLDEGDDGAGPLMVLRTIRLARLARTIRLLIKFRVLWMLVRGLLSSAETMFYTLTVLLIMLYVFATIGIELVTLRTKDDAPDEEFQRVVDKHFATLTDTMLTLMQFACLDSIGAIYRPLIAKDMVLALYFLAIILIIPIVLMNLVTAIIVNSAMEQATHDKNLQKLEEEKKKAQLLKQGAQIFRSLDVDKTNSVSREEMEAIGAQDREILCDMCGMEDPLLIFDSLDVDGSGELDIDEFCDGIWKAVTSKTPIEMQRMEKQIKVICDRQREAEKRQEELYLTLRIVRRALQRMDNILDGSEAPAALHNRSGYCKCSSQSASELPLKEAPAFQRTISPAISSISSGAESRRPGDLGARAARDGTQEEVERVSVGAHGVSIKIPFGLTTSRSGGLSSPGSPTARFQQHSKDSVTLQCPEDLKGTGQLSLKTVCEENDQLRRQLAAAQLSSDELRRQLAAAQVALTHRQQGSGAEGGAASAPPAQDTDEDDRVPVAGRPHSPPRRSPGPSAQDPEARRVQL